MLLDLYTKYLAIEHLAPNPAERGHPFPVWKNIIPGIFDLRWAENTGGAFSFMHDKPWVILLISSVMIIGILIWAFRMPNKSAIVQVAFGLIIGGAIGNLIDRVRFGYVVDFLHFFYVKDGREYFWPTFNVADIGIVVGIGLFMYLTAFTTLLDTPTANDTKELPPTEDATPQA